jgi:hypothetical protein
MYLIERGRCCDKNLQSVRSGDADPALEELDGLRDGRWCDQVTRVFSSTPASKHLRELPFGR